MNIIVVILYLSAILINIFLARSGKKSSIFTYVCYVFILILCCSTSYTEQHDLRNYYVLYNYRDLMKEDTFGLYYLFYYTMIIGRSLKFTFEVWWTFTTGIALLVIIHALKVNKMNPHVFLSFFMMYFVFNFSAGLKFFYGFAFLFLGFGYLIRGGKRSKLYFVICVCIAGGLHFMYYAYLIFCIIRKDEQKNSQLFNKKNKFTKAVVIASLIISAYLRINNSANSFLQSIFSIFDSEHIDVYLGLSTGLGFMIPVVMHLTTLLFTIIYRKQCMRSSAISNNSVNVLVYSNILLIIFYPLFMISTTFMRLITCMSMVSLGTSGYIWNTQSRTSREKILWSGFALTTIYIIYQLLFGTLWESTVLLMFS